MKKLILVLLLSSLSIAGCSTNTKSQNTSIGAVSGAVVGGLVGSTIGGGAGKVAAVAIGAVGGALIGGYVGHNMDSSDVNEMNVAMNDNPTYKATTWTNSKTGSTYTIVPTSKMMNYKGISDCRRYRTTDVSRDGTKHQTHGVACRQADGNWKAV